MKYTAMSALAWQTLVVRFMYVAIRLLIRNDKSNCNVPKRDVTSDMARDLESRLRDELELRFSETGASLS